MSALDRVVDALNGLRQQTEFVDEFSDGYIDTGTVRRYVTMVEQELPLLHIDADFVDRITSGQPYHTDGVNLTIGEGPVA